MTQPINSNKGEGQCEAKYGDKKCENKAERTVYFFGTLYNLCRGCAKTHNKQMKLNNN